MAGFKLSMKGLKEVVAGLKYLDTRLDTTLDRPLREVLELAQEEFGKQFDSQGSHFGTPWAPLRPQTIYLRDKLGFSSGPILQRSRVFRKSITTKGAKGNVFIVRDNSAVLGSTLSTSDYPSLREGGKTGINMVELHEHRDRRSGRVARRIRHPAGGIGPLGMQRAQKIFERYRDNLEKDFKRRADVK
jgi:hypothetical protein